MGNARSLNIDVVINGEARRISGAERTKFVHEFGIDEIIKDRYAEVLIVDLMINQQINGIDPSHVIREIKLLDSLSEYGYTKEATQFNRAPLHPLWHKHYFSDHFIIQNIQNEIRGKRFNEIWDRSMGPKGSIIEKKHIDALAHNLVTGSFEKRSEDKRLTGEWIVFSKHATGNIYLCMATHTTGDANIYEKVAFSCKTQFPLIEPFATDRMNAKGV